MKQPEPAVRLGHGGGGLLMRELLRDHFVPHLQGRAKDAVLEDAAIFDGSEGRMAMTTDGFVVDPLIFPGGDIGDLAINGTVNDLAVMGAIPKMLSVAVILEEGLPFATLDHIIKSMAEAASRANVPIRTGDTKVVPRGKADGMYITTTGIGEVIEGTDLSASHLKKGDKILVSGPIGDHGIAVMSKRAGLSFEADVVSDTRPLIELVRTMLDAFLEIHAMRDATRGGLAAVLNEFAEDSMVAIEVEGRAVPVRPTVRSACDVLGLDPLHVPCEGTLVAAVPPEGAPQIMEVLKDHPDAQGVAIIGEVVEMGRQEVSLLTEVGGSRLIDLPAGELLPRIC